jgi:HSP20 family molecular chaperone IbpA
MKTLTKGNGNDRQLENVNERPSTPPRADIFENKDEYLVVADLPGVDKDALDVSLDEEILTLSARVTPPTGEPVSGEYRATDYYRRFQVPDQIDRNQISARLENGVLFLHLPKSEAVKPRKITVRAG